MSEDRRSCCATSEELNKEQRESANRWVVDDSTLDAELPQDVRSALGRFLGVDSVDTLGEWATAVRQHLGGDSITIEELCVTSETTEHWGTVDGDRYYFECFYDAVILAALSTHPVDIHTKSPERTGIEARVVGSDALTVAPDGAVFSFGIDDTVESPDSGPTLEDGYDAICPYVKAFPNSKAYGQWVQSVPAATVAMPLAGATELAATLVGAAHK